MADYPAFPLWTDAYLADTTHLSELEHGRYLLFLMHLWRAPAQRFPNTDAWLARKFGKDETWVRECLRPLIAEFCQTDGNWITQKRLSREWKYVSAHSEKQSARAKSRWQKEKDLSRGNAASGIDPALHPHPHPQEERKKEEKVIHRANGHGKNGTGKKKGHHFDPGSVTIPSADERINRFAASLAKAIGPTGWTVITKALDLGDPEHTKAVAHCQKVATSLKKGWPLNWPAKHHSTAERTPE